MMCTCGASCCVYLCYTMVVYMSPVVLQSFTSTHTTCCIVPTHPPALHVPPPPTQGTLTNNTCIQHVARNTSSCGVPNSQQCSFVFSQALTSRAQLPGPILIHPSSPNWFTCARAVVDGGGGSSGNVQCVASDMPWSASAGSYMVCLTV